MRRRDAVVKWLPWITAAVAVIDAALEGYWFSRLFVDVEIPRLALLPLTFLAGSGAFVILVGPVVVRAVPLVLPAIGVAFVSLSTPGFDAAAPPLFVVTSLSSLAAPLALGAAGVVAFRRSTATRHEPAIGAIVAVTSVFWLGGEFVRTPFFAWASVPGILALLGVAVLIATRATGVRRHARP